MLYVATADAAADSEMRSRIEAHRKRRPAAWETLEVLGKGLNAALDITPRPDAVLVDSLTLWVSARMLAGVGEEGLLKELDSFFVHAISLDIPVILVSDEVGQGVVPVSAEGRAFRDILGLVNQRTAAAAKEVYLCVAGLPLQVK